MLSRVIDKKMYERASVYILDNKIIKYRGGSCDKKDIKYMMGHIRFDNSLDLKSFTLGEHSITNYEFSETDVKSHVCDLILKGKDLVWQNGRHIDVYTTEERRHRYDDCIRIAEEFNINLNMSIIIRGARINEE